MKFYSIAVLKSQLSKIIGEVLKGEEVIVTDHNKPVVKVIGVTNHPKPLSGSGFDLKKFLDLPPAKLKPGALSSLELLQQIRDE